METPRNMPEYLKVIEKELYYKDVNLMSLVRQYGGNLEVMYTDQIREKITSFQQHMSNAIAKYCYPASFYYAYATKANYLSEVVTTATNYADMVETSSERDIELLLNFYKAGGLRKNSTIICNGTKTHKYFESIEELKMLGLNVIPTFEAVDEILPFLKSDFNYEVGIRINIGELCDERKDDADRFGATKAIAKELSDIILKSNNLTLKLLHYHTSTIEEDTNAWLKLAKGLVVNFYKPLRKEHKTLEYIDLGGGLPAQYDYDFNFNYKNFANKLIKMLSDTCAEHAVMPPSIIGEYGRYTVADSGFHITKVTYSKKLRNNIWYILKNSIMGSFPDSWALKQNFIVLPLNLWGNPVEKVKLGGATCDPDDVYYAQNGKKYIELPQINEGETLYLAFFATGAYQQMIAGVGGTHHCMIAEGRQIVIYKNQGQLTIDAVEKVKEEYTLNLRYADQTYLKRYVEPETTPINTYVKHGKYRVVIGEDVDEKLYKKTMVLDKKVFDEFLADDSLKTVWYNKCPKLTVALVNNENNNVVGYITCYPIKDQAFRNFVGKKITYFDLKEKDIDDLSKPGYYNLYYFSTVVDPALQGKYIVDPENELLHNKKVFTILNEALVEVISNLASKGVMFKTFLFDSIAPSIDKYAAGYNLLPIQNREADEVVNYANEFSPKCFEMSKNADKLNRYYQEAPTGIKKIESTPLKDGFTALSDFDPHQKLYILWPERPDVWRNNAQEAQKTFYNLIKQISEYEKIVVGVTNLNEFDHKKFPFNDNVQLIEIKHNDSWARDTGPIGLVNPETGEHRAAIFGFNAYGGASEGLYCAWNLDRKIALEMCKNENMDYYDTSSMVLEGGSVVANGKGTLITTEECLLNKNRNPHMTKEKIEQRLKDYMGIKKIIWLNKGIYNDETNGHVDNICNFVTEDEVILAWPKNEDDEQYAISLENYNILVNSTTAEGKPIKVHKLILPDVLRITKEEGEGIVTKASSQPRVEGERMAASYINMLVSDKFVILPAFNDSSDKEAAKLMQKIYPDKKVISFYSREILLGGGNIHCITKHL